MATAELYRQVNGIAVPGHTLEEIQGTSAIPKGLPFRDGHIPEFSLVSVNETMSENPDILKDRLVQISPIHCRSFELRFGETGNMYWADEYRNVFSTLTTKGNNLDNPRVVKNSVSPSGYIVWGLQDSDAMVRVLRASELMRANNIPTEMIIRVIEPLALPFNGKMVSLEELKGSLLTQIWEQKSKPGHSISKVEIPDLSVVLDKMTFYITIRGLQVSERLQDLTEVKTKEDFLSMMRRVFGYVNMIEGIKAKQDTTYVPTYFDTCKDEDIETYILDYLPKNIATNIARMHRLGLIHRFPHLGNISAVGSPYDLDSVRGEPLGIGDNSITEQDCISERKLLMEGEKSTNGYGLLKFIDDLRTMTLLNSEFDLKERFVLSFQKAYIAERGWEDDVMVSLEKIYNFFSQFKSPSSRNSLLVHYVDLISNQIGWNFDYPQDIEGMKNLYKQEEETDHRREFERVRDNISTKDYYADSKISKQDNDSNILLHRDTSAAFRALEIDLRKRYAVQLQVLSTRYDQKMIDMMISMFVLNYIPRFFKEVDPDDYEEDYIGRDSFKYFKIAIKQEGWEKDVVPHLQQIDLLFENFEFPAGENYLEYYLALLKEQTGIDFPFYDSDIGPFFDGFIEWSKENFELYLEKAIAEAPSGKDLQTVIKEAYDAGYSQDEDFPWDNWITFVPEKASWIIEERCGSKIEAYLTSRFDGEDDRDRIRGDVYRILTGRAEKKLIIALTDGVQTEILHRQNQMELEIMAKYTTKSKQSP